MRTSTASGLANELRKLKTTTRRKYELSTTTRRKYEDETFPPAIHAFVDACSGNRAHPGGSEHV